MLYALKLLLIVGVCFIVACSAQPGKAKGRRKCPKKPCPGGKVCVRGICVGNAHVFPPPYLCDYVNCPPKRICKKGECVCRSGVEVAGKCLPFPLGCPYVPCGVGKRCVAGKCIAIPLHCPFIPCGFGKRCVNGKCVNSGSCVIHGCGAGKVCRNGKCVCKIGYNHDGKCDKCPGIKIYKRCPTSCPATCKDPNPSFCTNDCDLSRKCVCPSGYVQVSKSNDKCILQSECKKYCGSRRCPSGYRCVAGLCVRIVVPIPIPIPYCPIPCPTNRHCIAGRCVCIPPYFEYGGRCIKPCWNNHCPLHSTCHDDKCVCHAGYVKHEHRCVAIPTCATIHCPHGQKCEHGHCVHKPSCSYLTCPYRHYCKDGHCIPWPDCSSISCGPGFICYDRRCIPKLTCETILCPSGEVCHHGTCRPRETCEIYGCPYGHHCINGKCVAWSNCQSIYCPPGQACHNGRCVSVLTCDTIGCPPGQYCYNKECRPAVTCATIRCPRGYTCENGGCKRICPGVKVYTECATSCPKTCANPDPSPCATVCRPGVRCVCPEGLYEQGGPSGTCVAPSQCQRYCGWKWCPAHSTCVGNRCMCTGYGPHIGCEW